MDPNFKPLGQNIGGAVTETWSEGLNDAQIRNIERLKGEGIVRLTHPNASRKYREMMANQSSSITPPGITPVTLLEQLEQDITPEEGNQGANYSWSDYRF